MAKPELEAQHTSCIHPITGHKPVISLAWLRTRSVMASKQMLVAVFAVAFLPVLAIATEHLVGDDKGWTLNFNYTAWAETKQFVVGDTLGSHIPPSIYSAGHAYAIFSATRN